MRKIFLISRGITGLYKTEPLVAILACLAFVASAFAMFFFYGFSESMADYTRETFEAEQRRYALMFDTGLTHEDSEALIRKLPAETINILHCSEFGDYEVRAADRYDTIVNTEPYLLWTEEGESLSLAPGEVHINYHQLDYSNTVLYLGKPFALAGKALTITGVINNYPIYNDIYLDFSDYSSLVDVTQELKLTFSQPLTTTEREALDALTEQYLARYSYLPPQVNQAASDVTWSFFGQFAVLVSFSLLSVCAVYYYLIRRNMLTRLVRFCFGQSRMSVLRHLLIETLVVGVVCLLTGGLIALLVFTLFTGYTMTADNILFSGGIYLGALLLFSLIFGRKAIAGLHVSGLREEL